MRSPFFFLFVSAFILGGCSNPRTAAKKELEEQHIQFTNDDFVSAASTGNVPVLILFGKAGINVNGRNIDGSTALIEAAANGKTKAAGLLLSAGADPRLTTPHGRDALIAAAAGGYTEIGQLLLSRGANPTVRDSAGWTALTLAAFKGHAGIVRLLAAQAPQQHLDEALLLASHNGDRDTVSSLLSQGAFVDARSPDQLTPLMIAAKNGNFEVAHLLLQNQADRSLVDADGKSAAQYAKDGSNQNIHRLFAKGNQGPTLKGEESTVNTPAPGDGTTKPLVALNGSTIRTTNSKIHALTYFQLDEYAERTLPVTLKDVDGVYAVLTRMDPTGIPADIKIAKGERIPGTPFRLESIEPQKVRSHGLPESTLDTARVRIQNIKTGANHLLVRNKKSEPIDSYAILTADNSSYRYVAKTGDIFQTVDASQEEKDYQVVAIEETNVAFKDLTNAKIFTVKKRRHL